VEKFIERSGCLCFLCILLSIPAGAKFLCSLASGPLGRSSWQAISLPDFPPFLLRDLSILYQGKELRVALRGRVSSSERAKIFVQEKEQMSAVFASTGFPGYPKVERSCENFRKLKWGEEALPGIYMKTFFEHS